jgi:hypothetical protein
MSPHISPQAQQTTNNWLYKTCYNIHTQNTSKRTAGRGKFKFGGQVGETDYSTAHTGSDPNYLGDVILSNHRL